LIPIFESEDYFKNPSFPVKKSPSNFAVKDTSNFNYSVRKSIPWAKKINRTLGNEKYWKHDFVC